MGKEEDNGKETEGITSKMSLMYLIFPLQLFWLRVLQENNLVIEKCSS